MNYRESKQVVNGEPLIFDAREQQMRRDAERLRTAQPAPPLHYLPLVCATVNCDRIRLPGQRYCEACRTETEALDEWRRAHAARPASRLRNFAWLALFVALMSALGYYVWPFVWAIYELWFGRWGQ